MTQNETRGLRLLAMDGGGVRGLSELLILEQLMPRVQEEASQTNISEAKPCDVFDIICGTSTGGLVAILLGCLRLTIKDAIKEYEHLSEEIFKAPKSKAPGREAKYSCTKFENVVKRLIKSYGGDENVVLLQNDNHCKVFVCTQRALAIDKNNPFLMRSYTDSTGTSIDGLTIWQAARATTAAPTFFKRLKIGTREYIDEGIGSNNPCKALLKEIQRLYKREPHRTVSCIVNIGTGIPKDIELEESSGLEIAWLFDVVKTLQSMATDCEDIAEDMSTLFRAISNFYLRFNVEQGLQGVEMDKYEKLNVIRAKTEKYLAKPGQQEKLSLAAKALASDLPGPCLVSKLSPTAGGSNDYSHVRSTVLSACPPSPLKFFGRDEELRVVHNAVGVGAVGTKRLVLWGFPGSGKTAIALHYKQLYKHEYRHLLWINASTQSTAVSAFSEIKYWISLSKTTGVAEMSLPDTDARDMEYVKSWLVGGSKNWMMIIDSADDVENVNIRNMLPDCDHGVILITSCRSNLNRVLDYQGLEVKELDEESSTRLLLSWAGLKSDTETVPVDATEIVRDLHGLPLAIEQAGAFLRKGPSFREFREILAGKLDWVMARRPKATEWTHDRNRCVHSILEMLHNQLIEEADAAAGFLAVIALLGPGDVRLAVLGDKESQGETPLIHLRGLQGCTQLWDFITKIESNTGRMWLSISELENSCMVRAHRNSHGLLLSVSLHEVVRRWVIDRFEPEELLPWVLFAAYCLTRNLKDIGEGTPDFAPYRSFGVSCRNILVLLKHTIDRESVFPVAHNLSWIYQFSARRLGAYYMHMNQHQKAQKLIEDVIEYQMDLQQSRWPCDEESLHLVEALGDCYRNTGQFDAAEEACSKPLEHSTDLVGDMESLTLRAAERLREVRYRHADYNRLRNNILDARPSYNSRPSHEKRAQTANVDAVAISFGDGQLAPGHFLEGYPHGEKEYQLTEELRLMRAEYGDDDLDTLSLWQALGNFYFHHENYGQAASCLSTYWTRMSVNKYHLSFDSLEKLLESYQKIGNLRPELPGLNPALRTASISRARTKLCSLLLNNLYGPQRSLTDSDDADLIIVAAGLGSLEMLNLLLDHGADPNFRLQDEDECSARTPLCEAVRSGKLHNVEVLLDRGARFDLCDPLQPPLVLMAAGNDSPGELVDLLLERASDPSDRWRGLGCEQDGEAVSEDTHAALLAVFRSRKARDIRAMQRGARALIDHAFFKKPQRRKALEDLLSKIPVVDTWDPDFENQTRRLA